MDSADRSRRDAYLCSRNQPVLENESAAIQASPSDNAAAATSDDGRQGKPLPWPVRWPAKATVILANGYVLFFFSERVFWSFPRPGDSLNDLSVTWLAYSLLGWIVLILIRRYRIASFLPVFLAGAVYGWITEGVVVDTFYGNEGNPFPLSVSFTGLSWHALLSVGVGWYWLSKAMVASRPIKAILISLAIGLGWGLWAAWWPNEAGRQDQTSLPNFAAYASVYSILFIGSWGILGCARSGWFRVGILETIFLSGLVIFIFVVARVPARPSVAWTLPPLLLLAVIGLRHSAGSEDRRDLLDDTLGRIRLPNLIALVLIPLAAIAAYAPFRLLDRYPATNVVLYVVTMPLGFWFFFRAVWPAIVSGLRGSRARDIDREGTK
jgi:hypothetical protein